MVGHRVAQAGWCGGAPFASITDSRLPGGLEGTRDSAEGPACGASGAWSEGPLSFLQRERESEGRRGAGTGWARGQAGRLPAGPQRTLVPSRHPRWRWPFLSCRAAAIASTLVKPREVGLEDPPQVAWEPVDENTRMDGGHARPTQLAPLGFRHLGQLQCFLKESSSPGQGTCSWLDSSLAEPASF